MNRIALSLVFLLLAACSSAPPSGDVEGGGDVIRRGGSAELEPDAGGPHRGTKPGELGDAGVDAGDAGFPASTTPHSDAGGAPDSDLGGDAYAPGQADADQAADAGATLEACEPPARGCAPGFQCAGDTALACTRLRWACVPVAGGRQGDLCGGPFAGRCADGFECARPRAGADYVCLRRCGPWTPNVTCSSLEPGTTCSQACGGNAWSSLCK